MRWLPCPRSRPFKSGRTTPGTLNTHEVREPLETMLRFDMWMTLLLKAIANACVPAPAGETTTSG